MPKPAAVYLTGGTARGAKLFGIPGLDVRPALARMRISVFEILRERVQGAVVADLFAGTGSMGFEALSRGADFAVFLDRDDRCIDVLERNAAKLRFGDRVRVVRGDALDAPGALAGLGRTFDLVFVDAPYALYGDAAKLAALEKSAAGLPLSPSALVLVEHRSEQVFPESWAGRPLADRRVYGGTTASFYAAT